MAVDSTIKKYRKFQVGRETVHGTEVAAARIIRALNVTWNDHGSWRKYVPQYDIGRMSLDPDVGEITRKGQQGRVETDLSFEDFLLSLLCGYKGGVAGVEQTGGEGDYLWAFKNAPDAADPEPDSFSAQFRMRNANGQNYDRVVPFGLVSDIELSFDEGGDATKLNYSFFARTARGGTEQVETAVIVGTITGSGNATVTVTAAGMNGSPKAVSVAVLVDDTAADVAGKIRVALAADADVGDFFTVSGAGANVVLTAKNTAANDATMNIAYTNGTCTGLTPDATSDDTTAGVSAFTEGLSLPTPFDIVAALDWKLYIDDAWANLGDTQVAATLRSLTWRYMTGIDPALFVGDGRLDHSDYRVMPRGAEISAEFEFNGNAAIERAAFEASSKRYIRIEALGAQIGAGDTKRITIDGSYQYPDGGFGELGRESNGNDVVSLKLRTVADDDDNDLSVEVVNSLATFPA